MMTLSYTQRTPSLTRIRRVLDDTESINREIADRLLKDIDRNIVDQGIWTKWAAPQPSTTYARTLRGKNPSPLFGLRGRFVASVGRTQFTIKSTSKFAALMQEGPEKRSWTIWPNKKRFLSFPHPDGVPWVRDGRTERVGLWMLASKVTHRGWPKRRLMPPADEVGFAARTIVREFIERAT